MTKIHHAENGFVMPFVLCIIMLLAMIAASFFVVTTTSFRAAARTADLIRAYYVADAGLADSYMRLKAGSNPGISPPVNYSIGPGQTGAYSVQASMDHTGLGVYTLTSTGTYHGVTKTLQLIVKPDTWARYGYLSNTEIDPVWGGNWFITGMISTGITETNGQFNIWGRPVFEGLVVQTAPAVNYWNPATDNPDFQRGLITNAPAITMPNATSFLQTITAGAQQSDGLYFQGNAGCEIVFLPDGTMNVTTTTLAGINPRTGLPATSNHPGWVNQNMPLPANKAIFSAGGPIRVEGQLHGQVSVGSDNDINIGGNLIYKTDPRTDPTCTDNLALIAKNSVKIDYVGTVQRLNAGIKDIEVDGYIVAVNQFFVENFWWFAAGNLVQVGGLTTYLPGGLTGLFDPSTGNVVFGYNQLQYFDTRLVNSTPPWFPPITDSNNRGCYHVISLTEP